MAIYLLEIDGYNPATASVVTSYFCTGSGYISGNITYLPRVKQPGHYRISMFEEGKTGGASSTGVGDITLLNLDGGLDYLKPFGFDGRRLTAKIADENGIATLFTGTIEQCVPTFDLFSFRLRDKQALLNIPLQPNKYAGSNVLPAGLEGVEDIKGKPKPLLWGTCTNVSPVLVNTAKLTYQVNDGALQSITGVYDDGIALTAGSDYANSTLLQAATVAAMTFVTCLAEGYFRLGSSPAGQITCDAIQGATAADRTTAQIAKALALRVLAADDIYAQGIIRTDAANPAIVGIYVNEETTLADVLDEVTGSIGAWYNFDSDGRWNMRVFDAPGVNPVSILTEAENISIERMQTNDATKGGPPLRYLLSYSKNYTVQKTLPASSSRGIFAALEWREATPAEDAAVKTTHLLAGEMLGTTLIIDGPTAETEALRRLNLYKAERDRLKVGLKLPALQYPAGGYWDDQAISDMPADRYLHDLAVDQANGYVYAVGGIIAGVSSTSVIRLDLANPTGAWETVVSLPAARSGHKCAIAGGYLYVIGGSNGTTLYASIIRLDLATRTAWDTTSVPDMAVARYRCAVAVPTNETNIYISGGLTSTSPATATDSVVALSTGGLSYTSHTALPAAIWKHSSLADSFNIYVLGGCDAAGTTHSAQTISKAQSPGAAWSSMTNMPRTAISAAAVFSVDSNNNRSFVVIGGYSAVGTASALAIQSGNVLDTTLAWSDPLLTDLPETRGFCTAVYYSGQIWVIGGAVTESTGTRPNTYLLRRNGNPLDRAKPFEIGRDIQVKIDRFDYAAGKNMKVIGTEINYESGDVTLDLWG